MEVVTIYDGFCLHRGDWIECLHEDSSGFTYHNISCAGLLPEVEILTRDAGKAQTPIAAGEENSDIYKPRVSTWGVFPRPADISKAVSCESFHYFLLSFCMHVYFVQ